MTGDFLNIVWHESTVAIEQESAEVPVRDPDSADNVPTTAREFFFGDHSYQVSSRHRVSVVRGDRIDATCVLSAVGGATAVHRNSAFVRGDTCYVAVGPYVCALRLPDLDLLWQVQADPATCFGVFDLPAADGMISHGEMEIARIANDGGVRWSAGGRDIFTEGFELHNDHVEVIDFEGSCYRIGLSDGSTESKVP
jgi:hypothetical protein